MTKTRTKVAGYMFIGIILIGLSEFSSFFISQYLSNRGVFYVPQKITQKYSKYLETRNSNLGWTTIGGDEYGARPDESNFFSTPHCVDVYGDSYTFSDEVSGSEAWASLLSEKLECRVRNFGVGGYGSDQALMRFMARSNHSKIVVLNHSSENIIRNINQFRYLIYPNKYFSLKPRFLFSENGLVYVPIPKIMSHEVDSFLTLPENFLNHEYFLPDGSSGIQVLKFPYTLGLIKSLNHYQVKAKLFRKSPYSEFYDPEHETGALRLTAMILDEFVKRSQRRGLIPIITIFPHCRDFQARSIGGEFPYKPLADYLTSSKAIFVDFGKEILNRNVPFEDLYITCSSHMNYRGNLLLSKIFFEVISEVKN